MKLVDNVITLPVITTLPIPVERVLSETLKAEPQIAIVIGQGKDGELYFASSVSDGGSVLWWIEKAKLALMEA
jgi:hypothetical protein